MDFTRKDEYDPAREDGVQEDSEMVETSGDKGGMTKRVAVLAGIGVLAAALLIAGLVKGCGGRKEEKPDGMQAVFEQYLEEDGNALDALDVLSEEEQQRVISAAISTLERLVGDGSGNYEILGCRKLQSIRLRRSWWSCIQTIMNPRIRKWKKITIP